VGKSVQSETLAGISLKTLLTTLIALLLFGIYIGVVFYGENSLTVWHNLREKQAKLQQEKKRLQHQNMVLQKYYFELKQLEPKE
jgi:cell division protein FtsX